MGQDEPPFFDLHSEPLARRVAEGLHKIGLALKHQAWHAANEQGLSPTQGQILAALSEAPERTASELAAGIGVTLPTVSDAVRVLVEKALVIKRPDPRHPRASRLALTAAGRTSAERARAWPEFLATAVEAMSGAEQAAFLTGLVKMIRTLQESGHIPVHRMCISCVHFRPHAHAGALPHHCAYVDAPMAERHLRVHCPEHEEASAERRAETWARLTQPR